MFNRLQFTPLRFPKRMLYAFVGIGFLFISFLLIPDFFTKGLPPFPGDFLQAWYEPWRSINRDGDRILLPHKPIAEDVFRHILPFKLLSIEAIKNKTLPLWNPYNGSGMPLLATANSGFFDPLNIVFIFFTPNIAFGIYFIIQLIAIGLWTFAFVRSLRVSVWGAVFSAVSFTLSGFVIVRLLFISYGTAIACLPALLLLLERFSASKRSTSLLLIPLVVALTIVSTQAQIALYILLVTILYGAYRLHTKNNGLRSNIAVFSELVAMYLLGAGIAAAQLAPTFELQQAARISPENSTEIIRQFLVPFHHLLTIGIPNFFGNIATYNYWGSSDYVQTVTSLGLIPLFLAFVGIVSHKPINKVVSFFIWTLGISILLAVNTPIASLIYRLPIPLISTGAPSRIFLLSTFALSVLSGLGFDALLNNTVPRKRLYRMFTGTIGAIVIIVGVSLLFKFLKIECGTQFVTDCWDIAIRNTVFALGAFCIGLTGFMISAKNVSNPMQTLAILFCLVTLIASGVYSARKTIPKTPTADLYPQNTLITALQSYTRDARVFGIGEANIGTNLATQFKIFGPQFYHPLYILRYRELLAYANDGLYAPDLPRGDASIKPHYQIDDGTIIRRERLLNLDSVRYRIYKNSELKDATPSGSVIWQDGNWLLIASDSALPRAYLVTKSVVRNTNESILKTLYDPTFDYQASVVLESEVSVSPSDTFPVGNAKITSYEPSSATIQTDAPVRAILVLTDNYYPGWNAYLDGVMTRTYRANYSFRAVVVPEGSHTITFRYEPNSVYIGIGISLLSLSMLIIIWVLTARSQTRSE